MHADLFGPAIVHRRVGAAGVSPPPWRQPRCKSIVSLVNSHTNATRIGWHLWEIDLRSPPGLLQGLFFVFGQVVECTVLPAQKAGGSSEGFIRFDSPEGVTKALSSDSARDFPFSMRRMPQARVGAGHGHTVVVGGLTEHTGDEMLREHFDAYGEVVGAEIPKPFRGYAFVRFAGAEDMQRCLSQSHSIDGCPVTVIKKPHTHTHTHTNTHTRTHTHTHTLTQSHTSGDQEAGGSADGGGQGERRQGQQVNSWP